MDVTRKNKWRLFAGMSATVALPVAANDYYELVDECLLAYALVALLSATCGSLFVWWWYKMGRASEVFVWLTALLFALCYSNLVMLWARWLFVTHCAYEQFISSPIWHYRAIPQVVVMLYLLALILGRLAAGKGSDER